MQQDISTLCEGLSCMLRDHCYRYTIGEHVDPKAEGYIWISSCHEEARPAYIPMPPIRPTTPKE